MSLIRNFNNFRRRRLIKDYVLDQLRLNFLFEHLLNFFTDLSCCHANAVLSSHVNSNIFSVSLNNQGNGSWRDERRES